MDSIGFKIETSFLPGAKTFGEKKVIEAAEQRKKVAHGFSRGFVIS